MARIVLVAQSCPTLCDLHGPEPTRHLCPWDFPGKHTGVGCHCLLQGIFLTQGLNLLPLYWQVDSLPLSHQGSPYFPTEFTVWVKVKVAQLCPTLLDPMDCWSG